MQGSLLVANEYQNSDLFWALRGGGGGTFEVVVDVTLRTFDEVPVIVSRLNIMTAFEHPAFWEAVAQFLSHLPNMRRWRSGLLFLSLTVSWGSGYEYLGSHGHLGLSEPDRCSKSWPGFRSVTHKIECNSRRHDTIQRTGTD